MPMIDPDVPAHPLRPAAAPTRIPALVPALVAALVTVLVVALAAALARPARAAALDPAASAYLAMHVDDPVEWHAWGPDVLERARAEGRLVMISSGYFACHWCHVMQAESYRDPEIAALLQRVAVPVKIDRELRPGLDAYLIRFVERTRGHAGWPLNVFLTPEGYPLVGLTYAPPEAFAAFLHNLDGRWSEEPERLTELARAAADAMSAPAQRGPVLDAPAVAAATRRLTAAARSLADEVAGGFGPISKFPMSPQLLVLLEIAEHERGWLRDHLAQTLDAMAAGGLRDHLGGGFFRYTTRPDWLVPHFEKMLYDNALLARVYLRGARVLDRPDYREIAFETLDFVLRELAVAGGGYASSLSALDAAGREGGYYLWEEDTLAGLLTPVERRVVAAVWGMAGTPAQDGGHLPVRAASPREAAAELGLAPETVARHLGQARGKLLAAREERELPRDDKVVAAWNGLLLEALAAAVAAGETRFAAPAAALAEFLRTRMVTGNGVHRALLDGAPRGAESLADPAYVARGLHAWAGEAQRPGDPGETVAALIGGARERFEAEGGWRLAAVPLLPGRRAEPSLPDGPMPSPSAVLLETAMVCARCAPPPPPRDFPGLHDEPFAHATHIGYLRRTAAAAGARAEP